MVENEKIYKGLDELLFEYFDREDYQIRLTDPIPKLLLKNGVTPEIENKIDEIIKRKITQATWKNSTYYRKGFVLRILF